MTNPTKARALDPYTCPFSRRVLLTASIDTVSPVTINLDITMPHETSTHQVLPDDFLATPALDLQVARINFAKAGLPAYQGCYAVIIDNVLSPEECQMLIHAAEAAAPQQSWERAMINIGGGEQMLITDKRNCGRIIWDDQEVIGKVWRRIEHVPEVAEMRQLRNVPRIFGQGPARRDELWRFTRPNERMRFLKYVGGEYFRPHCDGTYETPDRKERTYFTLHLYLNSAKAGTAGGMKEMEEGSEELLGGATTFHEKWNTMSETRLGESESTRGNINAFTDQCARLDVMPVCGRILLFQHRDLIHSGDDVVQGTKYTMRTDLMYTLEEQGGGEAE